MNSAYIFPGFLCALGGGLLVWHLLAWRTAPLREQESSELQFVRRQLRRRAQASGMIVVLGLAIAAAESIESHIIGVLYWSAILLGILWIGLVALADMIATQYHFRSKRNAQVVEQAKLRAQLNAAQRTAADGPSPEAGKRRSGKTN